MTKKDNSKLAEPGTTFRYSNETFSGCDMVATITLNLESLDSATGTWVKKPYTRIIGEMTTVSYSIHMEKRPVRSIGNVNAKEYVMGPRTIAGSLVFSVFNRHFAKDIMEFIGDTYSAGTAYLVDELPPFDLTISAANEYGYRSRLAIYGIRLLNEGQVMSVNDVYTENTYQFFATDVEYLNDEMKYTKDLNTGLYKLEDNEIQTYKKEYEQFKYQYNGWTEEQQKNYESIMDRPIKIIELIKHPTRENQAGIVNFSISPSQDEGIMYIENSKSEITKIQLKVEPQIAQDSRSGSISTSLMPDIYTAYFQNTRSKITSNKVRFRVKNHIVKNEIANFKPLIESLTDTEVKICANEVSHNMAKISLKSVPTSFDRVVALEERRCVIKNLTPDTEYYIFTYNDNDNILSPYSKIKTLKKKDKMFDELEAYCYANSRHLAYKELLRYFALTNEAKEIAEQSDLGLTDSLLAVKDKYFTLYNECNDEKELEELKIKIFMCNELLYFAEKLNNDFIDAVNENVEVIIPTTIFNDAYENIFTFDKSITSVEFYRRFKNIDQFIYESPSYNFKNIEGVDNSLRFVGKPGYKHYAVAKIGKHRSPKLEFYVMTQKEREQLIEKDESKKKLTDKDIEMIDSQITKDKVNVEDPNDYKRSFMINAKMNSNTIFIAPDIETINENVLVRTAINNTICEQLPAEFFLCVATYQNILCDNDIYKVKFTSLDEIIPITKLHQGLQENESYSIWVEDMNEKQLSNVSTFIYNSDFEPSEDDLKKYEIKDYISEISSIAKNTLPQEICNQIIAMLENDSSLMNYEIVSDIILTVASTTIKNGDKRAFFRDFKKFIGIRSTSDATMLSDIEYNRGICTFNSTKEGSLLLINSTANQVKSYTTALTETNSVNTNIYKDLVLLIAMDKNLTSKSSLILINTTEQSMEVL